MQDTLEEKLGAIECESENTEVQWKNIKECVLDTISDLVGKVEKRACETVLIQILSIPCYFCFLCNVLTMKINDL